MNCVSKYNAINKLIIIIQIIIKIMIVITQNAIEKKH